MAAEASYHFDCRTRFMNGRYLPGSEPVHASYQVSKDEHDDAFEKLIQKMNDERGNYNSVSVHQMYKDIGGIFVTRSQLIDALKGHFNDDIVILHVNGFAKILMFHEKAMAALQMVRDDEDQDDDLTPLMKKLSKNIKRDIADIPVDTDMYNKRLTRDMLTEYSSDTLQQFLNILSPGLGESLKGLMICNILLNFLEDIQHRCRELLGYSYEVGKDTSRSCMHMELLAPMMK